MSTRRPTSWFLTERGRRFSFALLTGTGIALTSARYLPNTFFIDNYKNFVHYYKNGLPAELPKELLTRYEKCLNVLKLTDVQKKLVKPFSAFGFDLFHAGSTSSKFGVVIGIPVNFTYKTVDDIDKDNVQVNQKKVDVTTETGKKLANALILPEKAQEFAICREILMTTNNKVMFESCYPFMCTFFVYNCCQYLNKRLNLYAASPIFRITLYAILGSFGIGTYFLLKDVTQIHYETEADKALCDLGSEYIEGGLMFYQKILERNQALRVLMGKEGERTYSVMGNENYGLRQPHVALIHRKQFFESKLKENADPEELKDLSP